MHFVCPVVWNGQAIWDYSCNFLRYFWFELEAFASSDYCQDCCFLVSAKVFCNMCLKMRDAMKYHDIVS